jgi:hypothetical protein
MSGRGTGGKGLGVYRPSISDEDALKFFFMILPKKYHLNEALIDWIYPLSMTEVTEMVDAVFKGDDYKRETYRETIADILGIPTVKFMNVENTRPMYQKAVRHFKKLHQIQVRSKRSMRSVLQQIENQVSFYPKTGYKYKEAQSDFYSAAAQRK